MGWPGLVDTCPRLWFLCNRQSMGWPSWALPGGSSCPNRASLFSGATAAGPCKPCPPLPCREASLRGLGEGPHATWFQDCDRLSPWDGPGPGQLWAGGGLGERPWGGWAGVPGEQSKGNLSSGGGQEQGAILEAPETFASTCSGLWLEQQGFRPLCSQQPWWEPQPILAGNILWSRNHIWEPRYSQSPARSPQLDPANRAALLKSQRPRRVTGRSGVWGALLVRGPYSGGLLGGEQGLWMGRESCTISDTEAK